MCKYVCLCVYKHIFPSSVHGEYLGAADFVQILASKYRSPLKGIRTLWRNYWV